MKNQLNFLIILTIFLNFELLTGLELDGPGVCSEDQEVIINGTTSLQTVRLCCKGYKLDSIKDICTPVCTRMCIQGICIAPDTCSCKPGYHQDSRNKNMCNAICSHGCINGFCSSPEVCRCNTGFAPNPENNNKCTKLCTIKRGDRSGACTCDRGYTKIEGTSFCGAVCSKPCINADCGQPETCMCWKGYHRDNTNRNQCNPMCMDIDCNNGVCTGFNECTCNIGFVKGSTDICEEIPGVPTGGESTTTLSPEVIISHHTEDPVVDQITIKSEGTTTKKPLDFETPGDSAVESVECSDGNCVPVVNCTKPCLNGVCSGLNFCSCAVGYHMDPHDTFNCQPECSERCENGYCSEPEVCTCNIGYVKGNDNNCEEIRTTPKVELLTTTQKSVDTGNPDTEDIDGTMECPNGNCDPLLNCAKPCINGECSGVNYCTCKEGFQADADDSYNCLPTCSGTCENGFCSGPEECSCNEGFIMKGNMCVPKCEPECEFGECIAPNQCKCNEGYDHNPTTMKCIPVCTNCTNGICSLPNVCTCNNGYVPTSSGSCEPFCKNGCINGECSAPNKCICKPGYSPSGQNKNECHPKCPKTCINGYCSEPDTCTCNKGHKMDLKNKYVCIPTCSKPCINGGCTKLDTCSCLTGYSLNPKNKFQCDPICSKTCINGHCSEPDTCTCRKGYEADAKDPFLCNPTCLLPCINGTCIDLDTCQCFEGFKLSENDTFTCVEESRNITECSSCSMEQVDSGERASIMSCSKPCVNGVCTDQDTCTCNPGYEKDPYNKMKCNPACSVMCINGQCTGPDTCTCRFGYVPDNVTKHICRPTCAEPCENGNCVGANTCACNYGYKKASKYFCEPICGRPCVNGKCIGPDKCSCNPGFQPEPKDRYTCTNCGNKPCLEPEPLLPADQCEFGMVFNEDTKKCVAMKECPHSCVEGVCRDGVCVCTEGFSGDTCENAEIAAAGSSMWMIAGIFAGVIGIGGVTGYFANTLRKNWGNTDVAPTTGTASTAEAEDDDVEKNIISRDAQRAPNMREDGQRHIPVWGGGEVVVKS